MSLIVIVSCRPNKENKEQAGQNKQRPYTNQIITEMDSNQDGKLSQDEAKGPIAEDFNSVDSNNDGFLTKEELEKAVKKQGDRRPPRQTNTSSDI